MQALTPSTVNTPIEMPKNVGAQEVKIMGKTFDSPKDALKSIREKSIGNQIKIIKELGRNVKEKNDDGAEKVLKGIANDESTKISHSPTVLTAAKTALKEIGTSEESTPSTSASKEEDDDGDDNDDTESDKKE